MRACRAMVLVVMLVATAAVPAVRAAEGLSFLRADGARIVDEQGDAMFESR